MWLNIFRNAEDPRVQENRVDADLDNRARPEAWRAIGIGKSMMDVIRDCEKAVGRGVEKNEEVEFEEPMREDLVLDEKEPKEETTEEDGPLPDFLNLKQVAKTCQIKPDTLETIRKKEKAIAEADDTAEAVRAYWGGDVTGGMTVTGKEVEIPEPYENEAATPEDPEVLDDKYKGALNKTLEQVTGLIEKGVWQRVDGTWWQTNPEGGKPIPYKPEKQPSKKEPTEQEQADLQRRLVNAAVQESERGLGEEESLKLSEAERERVAELAREKLQHEKRMKETPVDEYTAKMLSNLGFEQKDWPMIQYQLNQFKATREDAKEGRALADSWTKEEEKKLQELTPPPKATFNRHDFLDDVVYEAKQIKDPVKASRLGRLMEDRNWHLEAEMLWRRASELMDEIGSWAQGPLLADKK